MSAPPLDRNTSIPASGIDGGYSNASFTQEPSTDQIGQDIFQTGNWYAARSLDKGKEWKYLDPFTLFGSGFCCDQVTAYDPSTGHQFWLALYSDHIVLANAVATGTNPDKHWCYYTFNAASVGQPSTTSLDYNDMEIADGDVYVATNVFGSNYSGSFVMRISAAQMATCGGIGYNYVLRTDDLTYKLAAGAGSTMYWGANWGQTNGSSFRVFTWPESSGSYTYTDYTVATYSFYTRNSGQNCGSADGVVDNWCQYSDSRPLGGALSGSTVAFSFNAAQDSSHPFPYTRIVYFDTSNNTYIGYNDIWATWGAIQFNSMAPNLDGQIGGEWAFGGGASGGSDYYPGAAVWDAPPGLWSAVPVPNYYLYGAGNTCTYSGLYRYGDYLTVRASQNKANEWIGAGYAILGANCGSTGWYADPHNVLFG